MSIISNICIVVCISSVVNYIRLLAFALETNKMLHDAGMPKDIPISVSQKWLFLSAISGGIFYVLNFL